MAVKWYLKKDDASWNTFWDKTSIDDELAEVKNDYPRMLHVILDNSNQDSVVLEGGCGLGKFLFFLREKGYKNLIGVDITDKPLQLINKRDSSIVVKNGDVNQLPITNNSIDMYLSMGVIEHFEEGPENALREANRVLKKDGTMIISVPYQNFYRSTIRRFLTMPILKLIKPSFRNKNRVFYQYYYSKKDLCRFINKSKFEVLDWFYYDRFHTKATRLGLYLEFPFLRKKNGRRFEVNKIGQLIPKFTESISKGIFTSNIVFIVRKK